MIRVLIVTQGGLGQTLIDAAERITGENRCLSALALEWDDPPERSRKLLAARLADLGAEHQILILTDMFGATPHNLATEFGEPGRVEVVAGVNLPMVLRLDCMSEPTQSVDELAGWIEGKGRSSIRRAAPHAARSDT